MLTCTCGAKLKTPVALRKHILASKEGCMGAGWLLGHLIIRGDPADKERIEELRELCKDDE